jgi:hypothetical protein
MSFAMMVIGDLEVPAASVATYLARSVEPARRDDWLGNLSVHTTSEPRTVEALLGSLPNAVSAGSGSWLTVRRDDGLTRIQLRGFLIEDDFYDLGVHLAEMFRVADDLGGRGDLWFLEEQVMLFGPQEPELCYHVEVRPNRARIGHPSEAAQRRTMATEGYREVTESVAASLGGRPR